MSEELNNTNEVEKQPDKKPESDWDSLDDDVQFNPEQKKKDTEKTSKEKSPTEEELKKKLIDEAKTVEEFDSESAKKRESQKAVTTPTPAEKKETRESEQREKLAGSREANPIKKFFGAPGVLSDIEKVLGGSISQTFGPDIYVLKNHKTGRGMSGRSVRAGYCEIKVGKETVFYAEEDTSSIFRLYKTRTFTNGKWRKELRKFARM